MVWCWIQHCTVGTVKTRSLSAGESNSVWYGWSLKRWVVWPKPVNQDNASTHGRGKVYLVWEIWVALYTCREFGRRVVVHQLDHVPFCSVSTGFKCFYSILLLSCAFGRKATRLSDLLQAERSCMYLWKQSLMRSSPLRRRIKKKSSILIFFSQSYSSFVSAMPICHCSCEGDAFFQSTEMAQLKAVPPVKGKRKVHAGSRSSKFDCTVHCQLIIIINV